MNDIINLLFSPFFMGLFIVILGAGLLIKFIGKSNEVPTINEYKNYEPLTQENVIINNEKLFCSNCGRPYIVNEAKKFCDNCGVSLIKISNQTTDKIVQSQTQTSLNKGVLTITFDGYWLNLYDTKIFINNVYKFKESTRSGFSVKVPIESSQMNIKTELFADGVTQFSLKELNVHKNYSMELEFSKSVGYYSSKYKLTEGK